MGESALVGIQVHRLVDTLVEQSASSGFRYVELVAPSGAGKSRIVREFYRRLAEQQSAPPYWPLDLMGGDADRDPVAGRKVIGPSQHVVAAPPGALPEYLWLTACPAPRTDGELSSTLSQLVNQFDTHEVPLVVVALDRAGAGEGLAWLRDQLMDGLRDEAVGIATEKTKVAIERLLDFSLPGAGTGLGIARRLVSRRRTRSGQLAAIADGHELKLDNGELADRLRDQILEVAATGMRVVMAVEDAHLIDPDMSRLIRSLHDGDVDVMVVASVWPEGTRRQTYAQLIECVRVGQNPSGYRRLVLDAWTDDELAELVLSIYPRTSDDVVQALVARFRTPLSLLLCLSLEVIRGSALDGRLDIAPTDLSAIASDPQGLMRQRWSELDHSVQGALSLTMAMTGAQGFEGGLRFVRSVAHEVGSERQDEFGRALEDALRQVHWLAELVDGVDGYREPLLAEVVLGEIGGRYLSSHLADLAAVVWSRIWSRLQLALLRDEPSADEEVLARWGRALLKRIQDAPNGAEDACRLVEARGLLARKEATAALSVLDDPGVLPCWDAPYVTELQCELYRALRDSSDLPSAIAVGARLVLANADGDISPDVMVPLRLDVAHWMRTSGMLDAAEKEYAGLLASLQQSSTRFRDVAVARIEHASAVGYLGDADDAEAALAEVAADCARELGPDDPLTLRAERSRWRWAGSGGRVITACTGLQAVWERMVAILGPDHPSTLFALSNLAHFTSKRGDHARAQQMLAACADGRRRALGLTHPHTIDSLRNETREARYVEGPAAAAARYVGLLSGELRALGESSPMVVTTNLDLAIALGEAKDIEASRQIAHRMVVQIGTAPTRPQLMSQACEYGDVDGAIQRIMTLAELLQPHAPSAPAAAALERWARILRGQL
ncbi:hypothetical protein ASC64_02545 [Nocardioides sp. Root122]|uniref:tetratricopeptide repeat protein n=1 Tax=Nocardioides TaxID=1839 RepID=UPI000702E046|nr:MULTISPECIES: tetratricopeptide repeat protein [Nocardioides]KQV77723.1 hypothetical protein ASC64_02545 [Nocardioides sp. Root122]MCK9822189.1 tetratricopeptide repeat protein [Nocardioides cavernae]